jgi:hypothetical protein
MTRTMYRYYVQAPGQRLYPAYLGIDATRFQVVRYDGFDFVGCPFTVGPVVASFDTQAELAGWADEMGLAFGVGNETTVRLLGAPCPVCAKHYGDHGVCDEGKPLASPHRKGRKAAELPALAPISTRVILPGGEVL